MIIFYSREANETSITKIYWTIRESNSNSFGMTLLYSRGHYLKGLRKTLSLIFFFYYCCIFR